MDERLVVAQHRGDDARGAVGRCGHDAAAGRILLVDGQRPEADPFEDMGRIGAWAAREQRPVQGLGAALDLQAPRQRSFGLHAAIDAGRHRGAYGVQETVGRGTVAPGAFVPRDELRDRNALGLAGGEQLGGAVEWMRRRDSRSLRRRWPFIPFTDDRAAADGVVAPRDDGAVAQTGPELQRIRMRRQERVLPEAQVLLLDEADGRAPSECELAATADARDDARDRVRLHALRQPAGQAQYDGDVGGVATARERQRSIQLAFDVRDVRATLVQGACEIAGRAHRADRMRARGPDADREQLGDADGSSAAS